jgi:hypothetical protein
MVNFSKRIENRSYTRLELSLPLKLLNHKVKTKNISSGGAYFEVVTDNDNIGLFPPGEMVKFEILAKTSTLRLPSGMIRLAGSGTIVRNEEMPNDQHGKRLGVALVFTEKLEILFD